MTIFRKFYIYITLSFYFFKNTIMEETLYTMEKIFNNLIQNYPNKWNGIKELENLKICLIDYHADIGVIFKEVEG
jgi:hypothetical protein